MSFYPFLKAIAAIMTGIMLLFCPIKSTDSYSAKDANNCELNFAVMSDAHVEGNNKITYERFAQVLNGVKKNKTANDAAVFLGDNTMNGQNIESMFFFGQINNIKPAKNIITCLGNHDIGNGEGDYNELLNRFIGYNNAYFNAGLTTKPYYYKVINGYYFIVLGSDDMSVNSMTISDEQLAWLDGVLSEATAGNKPAFVFCHHPATALTDRSDNYVLLNTLNKYSNVFFFYGHTHWTLNSYSFSTYDKVTLINLPRCVDGNSNGTEGVGAQVEVYDDSVVVRPRDYYTGTWLTELEHTYTIAK